MSRELKFRAWDTGAKRWTSGVMPVFTGLSLELKPAHSGIIIEQYTGLKDKNGKEIYEGDIVVWSGQKYVIRWHEGAHGVWQNNIQHFYVISAGIAISCEIIGNIHENPKLLEKK